MQATLRSNSGEAEFTIEPRSTAEYALDAGFESSISLRGRHWDGDHSFPFSGSIEGLWLRAHDLKALRDHIAKWTQQPLDRLIVENLTEEFKLTRLPEQLLSVSFGPRAKGGSRLNPMVSVVFSAGALRGNFSFETDQSCLSICARALAALPTRLAIAPKGREQTSPGQRPGLTKGTNHKP